MKKEDLRPGDIILSHKKPGKWNLLKKFLNWRLKRYAIRKYGKKCRYSHMDHWRTYMGEIDGVGYVGHWTDPAATYDVVQDWMVQSTPEFEVHIFRPKIKTPPTVGQMFEFFSDHAGSIYDIFDLVGMELGITRWFYGLGKKNLVCSSGGRLWAERVVFGVNLDSKVKLGETPPCAPAQYQTYYQEIA